MLAPESGEGRSIVESEQTFFSVLPVDHVVVRRLLQHTESELPELCGGWDICGKQERDKVCVLMIILSIIGNDLMCDL